MNTLLWIIVVGQVIQVGFIQAVLGAVKSRSQYRPYPIESGPMAIDAFNRYAYVTNKDCTHVSKIELATFQVVAQLPVDRKAS